MLAAGQGYLWGNLAALALAAVALLLPWTHRVIEQIGVISHCLPLTAVGPVILVIFGGRTTLHVGPQHPAYVMLPVIPAR